MTFIQNLIRTLPENISARRIVLQAAFEALPAEHPDRLEINSILAMLESHETARLKFAGKQKETANEFKPRRREEHGDYREN